MAESCADVRVLIAAGPASIQTGAWQGKIVQMTHPQTGKPAAFLHYGGTVQEINCFKPQFGAWFADNSVIQDGSLYLCSPVDTLFLALPLLEASRKQGCDSSGVFQDSEQIFQPHATPNAEVLREVAGPSIPLLCDSREVDTDVFYRLNDAKVVAWLKCKVRRTATALKECSGAFASMDQGGLDLYAVGMLGEYLSPAWHARLKAAYNFEDKQQAQPLTEFVQNPHREEFAHPEKKLKLEQKAVARKRAAEIRDEKKAQQVKRETAGMKKMSSFFTAKAKA